MSDRPDEIDLAVVDSWLASATLPGASPMSALDAPLQEVLAASDGSFGSFIVRAYAAIESAADRGVASLDETAVQAALQVGTATQ